MTTRAAAAAYIIRELGVGPAAYTVLYVIRFRIYVYIIHGYMRVTRHVCDTANGVYFIYIYTNIHTPRTIMILLLFDDSVNAPADLIIIYV